MPRLFLALMGLLLITLPACRSAPEEIEPVDELKILVRESGLYRLSTPELQAVGFSLSTLQPDLIQLSEAGRTVPMTVDENGLIFYGRASTSRYTPFRAYVLRVADGGLAMETRDASSVGDLPSRPTIRRTQILERNLEYVSDARGEHDDQGSGPWFWQTIGLGETEPIVFHLPAVADGAVQLRARFVGITHHPIVDPDHTVLMTFNDQEPISFSWDGRQSYVGSAALAAGTLLTGENRIQFLDVRQEHLDISKLDWIEIEYESPPQTDQDYLEFSSAPGAIRLESFSLPPVIVDVADPARPVILEGTHYEEDVATVGISREGHYIAAADDGFLSPAGIEPMDPGEWDNTQQQADLLIVTTRELVASLEPLVAARAEQGLSAVVVPVEQIYDRFGHGAATPESINQFVTFAAENWDPPAPRYLLLVGDATIDYWGFLADGTENSVEGPSHRVPPYLVPVNFGGETVSDARIADIDGDYVPDLAVGRWPVDSVDEVRAIIERTLQYESSLAAPRAIFAADGSSNEFSQLTESLLTTSGFSRDDSQILVGPTTEDFAESWKDGAWLVTYAGHGSLQLWSQDGMLSAGTLPAMLTPGVQPIVLQLTCLTGLFAHPEITSLSEVMLNDDNGPALVIAATSLTLSAHQEPFAAALLNALQNPSVARIGDALQLARQTLDVDNVGLREINDTFALLGDPSARIVRPE